MIARYGSTLFRAFYEVEVALTNEAFLAPQLQEEVKPYNDCREAVGLART